MQNETFGGMCVARIRRHLAATGKRSLGQLTADDVRRLIDDTFDEQYPERSKRQRARDLVFEALVEIFGANLAEMTEAARGPYNRAAREIKAVCEGMPADEIVAEIRARSAEYRRKHRDWPFTAPALIKHWPELRTNREPVRKVEDEPADWVERFLQSHEGWSATLDGNAVTIGDLEYRWATLPKGERAALVRKV